MLVLKTVVKFWNLIFFLLALLFLLAFGLSNSDVLYEFSKNLNPLYLLLSFLSIFSGQIIASIIWHMILQKMNIKSDLLFDIKSYIYSLLGSLIPGNVWSIASKISNYSNAKINENLIVTGSIVEAILISCGSFIIFLFANFLGKIKIISFSITSYFLLLILIILLINPITINFIIRKTIFRKKLNQLTLVPKFKIFELAYLTLLESVVTFLGCLGIILLIKSYFSLPENLMLSIIAAVAISNVFGNLLFWLPGTLVLRDGFYLAILTMFLTNYESLTFTIIQRVWLSLIIILSAFINWVVFDKIFHNQQQSILPK